MTFQILGIVKKGSRIQSLADNSKTFGGYGRSMSRRRYFGDDSSSGWHWIIGIVGWSPGTNLAKDSAMPR